MNYNQGTKNPNYKHGKYCTKHYCKCGIEISPIANRCGLCYGKWRSINIRGNKIATFIDGKSHDESYPAKFSYYLKKQIKIRDNHKCQLCKIEEIKFKQNHIKGLEVHHIDYNKENCKENNLITLCGSCNKKVNLNRDYWYAYFKYILEEQYGIK
jgi:5-methylcytosine-specific restriction endonuclease McrA